MVASFCQGLSGSLTSVITGVTAYLTSVTKPEQRINRLLILFAFFPLAGMVGPLTAGALQSPLRD
jgi:MFS family permease